MARIELNIDDAALPELLVQLRRLSIPAEDTVLDEIMQAMDAAAVEEDAKRIIRTPVEILPFRETNAVGESCLYIAGDQRNVFSGRVVDFPDGTRLPVVGVEYQSGRDRSRIIFAKGDAVSQTVNDVRWTSVEVLR